MAQPPLSSFLKRARWVCQQCQSRQATGRSQISRFTTSTARREQIEIRAAAEIDFDNNTPSTPARIVPASPSYFTGTPVFMDDLLRLQNLVNTYHKVPQIPADKAPRMAWLRLTQYRSASGEKVGAGKYSQLLRLLARLNRIHPQLRADIVNEVLEKFQRPGAAVQQQAKPGRVDENGVATAIGRRKTASAKVSLVEGTGEILINSKSIVTAFPRLHDRESVMWPLLVTNRADKYNVFALASGGGFTGQAEAINLGLTRALLVHEPALKPFLRRAGCVTRDPRSVERKKPGRLKARKRPTWVKR